MISKQKRKGVSPVVGVILMVAITVIIAAVVANFVLDLGQQLGQDADATINIDQEPKDFATPNYNVTVTVSDMQNSEYIVVTAVETGDIGTVVSTADTSNNPEGTPSSPSNTNSVSNDDEGGLMYRSGDKVTVPAAPGGTTIQIYGGIDGQESLIQEYEVEDTIG
jgi:flagellin-like protein